MSIRVTPATVFMYLLVLLSCFCFGCSRHHGIEKAVEPPEKAGEQPELHAKEKKVIEKQEPRRFVLRNQKKKEKSAGKTVPVTPPFLSATQAKKVFEFVDIDGEHYPVPKPWRGSKVEEPTPELEELGRVPQQFSHNGSTVYIHSRACRAFVRMAEKARQENVHLKVHSGFRSKWYQRKIFSKLMAEGRTWDDLVRYVAPPGYSEHATGMVVDLYPSDWQFASTPAYSWLKENAGSFGFSETYPEKSSAGFPWEAWHWRYDNDGVREEYPGASVKPQLPEAAEQNVCAKYKQ